MSFQSFSFLAFLAGTVLVCPALAGGAARPPWRRWNWPAWCSMWPGMAGAAWRCWRRGPWSPGPLWYGWRMQLRRIGRRTLVLACIWHIGVLAGFKYTAFFTGGAVSVGWAPLGLSFFTFQQLWLLKEVYDGSFQLPAQDGLVLYALFFPTVTSGPILPA